LWPEGCLVRIKRSEIGVSMLEVSGEITKKNEELGYGFVSVKGSEDIFFSPDTAYSGTSFATLKVGEKVTLRITETARGLFASALSPATQKRKYPEPEVSI
jgi:cold shock CspA family protein